jgi:hypothetical protein
VGIAATRTVESRSASSAVGTRPRWSTDDDDRSLHGGLDEATGPAAGGPIFIDGSTARDAIYAAPPPSDMGSVSADRLPIIDPDAKER